MERNILEQQILNLTKDIKIDEQNFDTLFAIDNVPLWWFFNRFITTNILPSLASFDEIHAFLEGNLNLKATPFQVFFLRKALRISNTLNQLLQKNKVTQVTHNTPFFLTYYSHITSKGVYRLQPILNNVEKSTLIYAPSFIRVVKFPQNLSGLLLYTSLTQQLKEKAQQKASQLHKLWKAQGRSALQNRSQNIHPLLFTALKSHLSLLFSEEFLYLTFLNHYALEALIETYQPSVFCITASIGLLEKSVIVICNKKNIPTLLLQHGFDTDFRRTSMSQFHNLYFAVYGKEDKKLLEETNVSSKNIFVTGGSQFDGLEEYISKTPEKVEIKNILLLSQPFVEDKLFTKEQHLHFLREVETIAQSLDAHLTIKLHPRDNKSFYDQYVKGKNITLLSDSLYPAIQNSDLVISVVSTTISESVVLNKPVVVLDLFNHAKEKAYVKRGVVLYATSSQDVSQKLSLFFSFFTSVAFARKRKEYIEDFFCGLDGKATKRIVETIEKLSRSTTFKNKKQPKNHKSAGKRLIVS